MADGLRHIGEITKEIEENIILNTQDPVLLGGFTQVPNFILTMTGITPGAKLVYALFLHYAWNKGRCFPGQETLAKDMGKSVSQVNSFVKELEKAELIEIIRRGLGKTNVYKVNFYVK